MPQMAPMWWTIIMFFSVIIMLITIMIVYFKSIKMIKKSIMKKSFKKMNWTW